MERALTGCAVNKATGKKKTGTDCARMCFVCTNSLSWNHYLGKCPDAEVTSSTSVVDCLYRQVGLFLQLIQQTDFRKHCLLVLLTAPLPVVFYFFSPMFPKLFLRDRYLVSTPPPLFPSPPPLFFSTLLFLSLLIAEPAVAVAVEAAA